MYLLATNVRVSPIDSAGDLWRWLVSADFTEVRSPSSPLLGSAGWSFDDLAGSYPTFAAVRASFDDFNAVIVGFNTETFGLMGMDA